MSHACVRVLGDEPFRGGQKQCHGDECPDCVDDDVGGGICYAACGVELWCVFLGGVDKFCGLMDCLFFRI